MFETKIKNILPFWCLGVALVIAVFFITAVFSVPENSGQTAIAAEEPAPQVLGVFSDLRGQSPQKFLLPPVMPLDDAAISAQSYLVADADSGTVLAEKNSGRQESIASLTKLLTGLIAYEKIGLATTVTISAKDRVGVSPELRLQVGDTLSVQDLFNAMLIGSDNDAAQTLANHVEAVVGQAFSRIMNQRAQDLAMTHSHFSNPLGFESSLHFSTAQDLLRLVRETQKLSAFTVLGKKTGYAFLGGEGYSYHTAATNKLIGKHEEIEAIKTGYTEHAGQAMITKATRAGHAIYIIVLESKDRDADTLALEEQVFSHAVWPEQ